MNIIFKKLRDIISVHYKTKNGLISKNFSIWEYKNRDIVYFMRHYGFYIAEFQSSQMNYTIIIQPTDADDNANHANVQKDMTDIIRSLKWKHKTNIKLKSKTNETQINF